MGKEAPHFSHSLWYRKGANSLIKETALSPQDTSLSISGRFSKCRIELSAPHNFP